MRLLLHLLAEHAKSCLPVGRHLPGRPICSIVEVVVVVAAQLLSSILLNVVFRVVPRLLLLGTAT